MSDRFSELYRAVDELEALVPAPQEGLAEPVFLLVSRLTPLLSVDLLIQDEVGRTLLTWRHDACYGPGWHVPGGIVRYRESAVHRIQEVARLELGARVEVETEPLAIHESIRRNARDRAHTVSMLYRCRLVTSLDANLGYNADAPRPGQWRWHNDCPDNLIQEQLAYQRYFRSAT